MLVLSLPPLSSGVTASPFPLLGKMLERILLLIAFFKGLTKWFLASFARLVGISSSPVDVFVFIPRKSFLISFSSISLKLNKSVLVLVSFDYTWMIFDIFNNILYYFLFIYIIPIIYKIWLYTSTILAIN